MQSEPAAAASEEAVKPTKRRRRTDAEMQAVKAELLISVTVYGLQLDGQALCCSVLGRCSDQNSRSEDRCDFGENQYVVTLLKSSVSFKATQDACPIREICPDQTDLAHCVAAK